MIDPSSTDTYGDHIATTAQLAVETHYHLDVPYRRVFRSCRGYEYQLAEVNMSSGNIVKIYKNRVKVHPLLHLSVVNDTYIRTRDKIFKL